MTALQRTSHSVHPAPGAVPTAAQRALQQERRSLPSVNTAGMTATAAGEEDEDIDSSAVSLTQLHSPSSLAIQPQQQKPKLTSKLQSARNSAAEGMRREWKFGLQLVHVAGQLLVPCSPQWEYDFIDIDRTAYGLAQRTVVQASADTTPMLAVLSYTDRAAIVQAPPPASAISSVGTAALSRHGEMGNCLSGGAAAGYAELLSNGSLVGASNDATAAAAAAGGDWWVEKSKQVELFYCHPAPNMTLHQFCKHCVKFILRDPHVVSVDGDSRLTHLRVGDKLRCPYQLGGQYRSFHMRYVLRDRSELQESYVYAIGALVGQRGYLLRVQCTSADELEGYVRSVLLPTYTIEGRARFGVDVTYHNVPSTTLLADQQEAFGELQYVDHKAAIVFVTPVYPMKILPDYSPAKTVGVGSITCMTLELSVHERLLDDAVAAEIIGVAKYKVNPVVLCVEVEEVSRMGYPKVMSTEQYSDLKAKRVADVFPDAKMVGLPTSLYMGNRTGRSRTMTFTYEPLRCVVKALVTSTLVGNFGVTAFYLTKLSGGLFDSHLYVFQQLLSGMEFLPQNNFAKNARVSRFQVQNIRLGEEDVIRAYRCANTAKDDTLVEKGEDRHASSTSSTAAAAGESESGSLGMSEFPPHPASFTTNDPLVVNAARERHLHMLALGNDGRVEGGVEAVVPAEEGGMPSRRAVQKAASESAKKRAANQPLPLPQSTTVPGDAADGAGHPASTSFFSNSRSVLTVVSTTSGGYVGTTPTGAAGGADDAQREVASHNGGERENNLATTVGMLSNAEADSVHSNSRISVEGIPYLMNSLSDSRDETSSNEEEDENDDDEEAGGGVRYAESEMQPFIKKRNKIAGQGGVITADAPTELTRSSSSLHRHGSCHSPPASASAERGEVGSRRTSGSSSCPTSGKRQKHGGQRTPFEEPHIPLSPVAVDGATDAAAPPGNEKRASSNVEVAVESADMAAMSGEAAATPAVVNEEALKQQELYEQLIGKGDPLVQETLREGDGGTPYGPSLRDVYARCCEVQQCRPNSYLAQKLPAQPELTYSVEELDLSSNYVGHNGFVAILHLLEHLPRLRVVYFNNMSLDNTDMESMCYVLATNATVREVHLENNTGISLPSMRHFTALLQVNRRIEVLALDGTRLSPSLVKSLKEEASRARD